MIKRIKLPPLLGRLHWQAVNLIGCGLSVLSPEWNVKYVYRKKFHKKIDLEHPTTFNEKLLWLKLYRYAKDPLVIQCADKYRVRDYVTACGFGHLLNGLLGVYDDAQDIPWEELPRQFVLKWNFGSGMNVICKDKDTLDRDKVVRQMAKWGKSKPWLEHAEMQYKYCDKKIICERYLEETPGRGLADYKVYCFNGQPLCVLVIEDRFTDEKIAFYDDEWKPLENLNEGEKDLAVAAGRPECLPEMLAASARLSRGFPFLRCDFYVVSGKLYFGEMTFTPAGGLYTFETKIHGKSMAELLELGV